MYWKGNIDKEKGIIDIEIDEIVIIGIKLLLIRYYSNIDVDSKSSAFESLKVPHLRAYPKVVRSWSCQI